ncbi:extensin-like [Monodon monoceros]|uniref:extensin-like n=1 Tax=Monodon monoceros TaxID=40151 RepID=UPI0010F55F35|nr:extensin-like [Monodon monoceros]
MPGTRPLRPARDSPRIWRPAQPFPASQPLYFYSSRLRLLLLFFPAQSGNPGLPKRAAEGPPFPRESSARVGTGRPGKGTRGECPAPNPPPRRPGTHSHPRRPAHRAAAPDPRLRRPRPRPDLLRRGPPPDPSPFPPTGASAPLPLSARSSRHPTWAPSEAPRAALPGLSRPLRRPPPRTSPPRRPGASLLPLCAPNAASPGALRSLGTASPGARG